MRKRPRRSHPSRSLRRQPPSRSRQSQRLPSRHPSPDLSPSWSCRRPLRPQKQPDPLPVRAQLRNPGDNAGHRSRFCPLPSLVPSSLRPLPHRKSRRFQPSPPRFPLRQPGSPMNLPGGCHCYSTETQRRPAPRRVFRPFRPSSWKATGLAFPPNPRRHFHPGPQLRAAATRRCDSFLPCRTKLLRSRPIRMPPRQPHPDPVKVNRSRRWPKCIHRRRSRSRSQAPFG